MTQFRQGTRFLAGASFLIIAFFSLISGARHAHSPNGNIDFHAYWYAGEHLRQRRNPYLAHQNAIYVEPPLTNIDSDDLRWTVSYEGKSFTPANTAPLLLLIAPLSYFTWQNAQIIWLIINLSSVLLIPLLATGMVKRATPSPESVSGIGFPETSKQSTRLSFLRRQESILPCLAIGIPLWMLAATRLTLAVGQTSLVVLVLLLGSIVVVGGGRDGRLADVNAVVGGFPDRLAPTVGAAMLLGIALSKYSLALSVFLYFVIRRRWGIVMGSVFVQLVGLLLLCGLTQSSAVDTLAAYLEIMRSHVGQSGIHFGALLPSGAIWQILAAIIVTIPTVYALQRRSQSPLMTLSILSVWTMLVAYHRAYDAILLIFPLVYFAHLATTCHSREGGNPFFFALLFFTSLPLIIGYPPAMTLSLLILLGWLSLAPSPTPVPVS